MNSCSDADKAVIEASINQLILVRAALSTISDVKKETVATTFKNDDKPKTSNTYNSNVFNNKTSNTGKMSNTDFFRSLALATVTADDKPQGEANVSR